MHLTDSQVQVCLEALRHQVGADERDGPPVLMEVPDWLIEKLRSEPELRLDRVAAARCRIDAGDVPPSDEVAGRVVGRLVCDRLR